MKINNDLINIATSNSNGLMLASDKIKLDSINNSIYLRQGLTSNIGTAYWANQINYIVLGKIVFCYLIINLRTKNQATLDEEAYVELPFTFDGDWYFPLMKANYSTSQDIFIQRGGYGSTNRMYLVKNSNRDKYKVSELPNDGYIIDTQFFALLK